MKFGGLDLAVIGAYFVMTLAVGLFFARRAKRSVLDYFLSARSMPWFIAGTAMVATTFSADTPLAVTEMVAKNGIAGNWLWWSMLASGMLTVFFFAKLWRRAAVVTDVELAELRYSGRPAAFLRGFRAAYLGLLVNIIIMGWVNLGMAKVLGGMLGVSKWAALVICLLLTALYTILAGYWGVAAANGFQYCFEMGGAIVVAFVSVSAAGGIEAMKAKLGAAHPAFSAPGVRFGSADAVLAIWPPSVEGMWVAAGDHLRDSARSFVVGVLVSRRGAGRRGVRRPEHARVQGRAATPAPPLSTSTSRTTPCGAGPGS